MADRALWTLVALLVGCGGNVEPPSDAAVGSDPPATTKCGGCAIHTTAYPIYIDCTSMTQVCSPPFVVRVSTSSELDVEFTAATTHCSDGRVLVSVDGSLAYTSPFISANGSTGTATLGPVTGGMHTLSVAQEGRVGGCDQGWVQSWAGTLRVTTCSCP